MSDATEYGKNMSVDEALLEPLGRVMWAAIRLHHGVRDSINHIKGQPSDEPSDLTLGGSMTELEKLAKAQVAEPDRSAILAWVTDEGKPATRLRNGVAHAVAYTDRDGRQALRGSGGGRPARHLEPELLKVVGALVVATRNLPPGPFSPKP